MDISAIAAGMAGAKANQTRTQMATAMMRQNADAMAQLANMLSENVERGKALTADGTGGNIDVSA